MKVNCRFVPSFLEGIDISGKTAIVIDVLRATTSIVTAFEHGAKAIYPVASIEDAFHQYEVHGKQKGVLLAGERDTKIIEGFHLGNSPYEFCTEEIRGSIIILSTTNGTRALVKVKEAHLILVASLLNESAAAARALASGNDVEIICSGDELQFSLEDSLCAGLIIKGITSRNPDVELSDSAFAALSMVNQLGEQITGVILNSEHGKTLIQKGFERDVRFCAQVNNSALVPVCKNNIIALD